MSRSAFTRTLSDVSSGDGSLSKILSESSQNFHGNSLITANVLSRSRSGTPSRNFTSPCKIDENKGLPGKVSRTPLRIQEGDRYIPNRQSTDITRVQHTLQHPPDVSQENDYERAIASSLQTDLKGSRILKFRSTANDAILKKTTPLVTPPKKIINQRHIPKAPEKVLDAPEIMDDFYLNLLDWSNDNLLAIALNREVYVWNAANGDILCLMSAGLEDEYICSVQWSPDIPDALGVGLSTGRVQIWSVSGQSLIRTMRLGDTSNAGRVPALTWREHVLTSGSRSGHVRHHDTRIAHHEIGLAQFHTQEVCGLAWSPDKRFLASGANDNCVAIWSASDVSQRSSVVPYMTLNEHRAAVKALAWCPWKPNLLCTGGGSVDRCIRFWNTNTGGCLKSIDVAAQVSGIIWNTEYREIITSHGGPKNQLTIWKYPDITKVVDLCEHQGRILSMATSPSSELIASCSADETLRIWHCFQVDQRAKKLAEERKERPSVFNRVIR